MLIEKCRTSRIAFKAFPLRSLFFERRISMTNEVRVLSRIPVCPVTCLNESMLVPNIQEMIQNRSMVRINAETTVAEKWFCLSM